MRLGMMIFIGLLILLPLGSSGIFIEPLKKTYNYGDQIVANTKIVSLTDLGAYYTVDFKCGRNISYNIYNSFLDLRANVETPVVVITPALNPLLENLTSTCTLNARFGNEVSTSSAFKISKKIIVESALDVKEVMPGKSIMVSGKATKESEVPLDGFIEIYINSLNIYKSAVIEDGVFNITILLPENAKSGVHGVDIQIHNTDSSSKKINFGSSNLSFSIGQILKEVEITTNSENAVPENDYNFRVDAFDQAGDPIAKEVALLINKPLGLPFIKKIIKSGEAQTIKFGLNDTPGYWSMEITVDSISKRKLFYLEEVQRLQTSLINNTLIVTNIGNAVFSGPIEITIGSFVEVRHVRLDVGESQRFTLKAPDGDYTVSVMDSGEKKDLGSVFLTGNAIKVTDFKEDFIGTVTNPVIWWMAIILLVLIIILVQVKLRMQKRPVGVNPVGIQSDFKIKEPSKKDFEFKDVKDLNKSYISSTKKDEFSFDRSKFTPKVSDETLLKTNMSVKPIIAEPKTNIQINNSFSKPKSSYSDNKFDLGSFNINKRNTLPVSSPTSFVNNAPKVAPSTLFGEQNQGIRERAIAIALFMNSQSPAAAETMKGALSIANEVSAKVYIDGDYKIILFSPRLTHNVDNDISAINAARRMQALFLEHMSLHNDGLNFGVGINDGEIISEIENGKFSFTSTGNLISFAKRIAYYSNTKLLISESIKRRVMSAVKTQKSNYQGIWEVVKVVDYSSNNEFINRFSSRNK